ncbi:hypothetical protein [Solirubrum puertoriconensis]|uniref:Lipoprotein n=1 Tax=Solirubrum puertoriconensis TaxID=1751427 RepID=A0A9X0HJU1_SOLP1|nr:hypothetical protein [Solirubrum puertoriconensis]KUG07245.1 hypothetical protein ASU33_12795 [Solirubrum puertoriconensis]
MKTLLFALLLAASCGSLAACTDGNKETDPAPDAGNFGNNARSEVPDELVGYWLAGSSSIGNFWGYDGRYAGPAYEIALGYRFYKNGTAKQYFYYTSTSTYCRTQVLGYREGTVVFDTRNKTFEFFAASGNYRHYNGCGSSQSPGYGETKPYDSNELYPAKKHRYNGYEVVQQSGKTIWRCALDGGGNQDFEKSTEPQR